MRELALAAELVGVVLMVDQLDQPVPLALVATAATIAIPLVEALGSSSSSPGGNGTGLLLDLVELVEAAVMELLQQPQQVALVREGRIMGRLMAPVVVEVAEVALLQLQIVGLLVEMGGCVVVEQEGVVEQELVAQAETQELLVEVVFF